jgi:hypothetical protein
MLKGKRILTENFFGTVLNDAEKEQVLIIRAIRERNVDRWDSIVYGTQTRIWWAITDRVVVIPWVSAGHPQLCQQMPKGLYARVLNARPRRRGSSHHTTIKGRRYIDW